MPSSAEWVDPPGGRSVLDLLKEMYAATQPGSRVRNKYRGDMARIVVGGIQRDILDGKDRYGKTVAKLAPSTLKGRKGGGPPRAPRGKNSRMVKNLVPEWKVVGDTETLTVRDTTEFSGYHQRGTKKKGGGIRMPARPSIGLSPQTVKEIEARHARLADDIIKGGG